MGDDVRPDWRRPELLRGCLWTVPLTLLLTAGWAIAAGTEHEALDREGIFSGMAAAAPGLAGVWLASRRADPSARPGAVLLRLCYHLFVLVPTALVLGLLCVPVAALGEDLAFVPFGAAVGALVAGLLGSLACGFAGGALTFWEWTPREAGPLRRASMGILLVAIVVMAIGLALGSRYEPGARRSFGDLVVALLGLGRDVESAGWLWVGRAGAIVLVVALVVVLRTAKRYAPERR